MVIENEIIEPSLGGYMYSHYYVSEMLARLQAKNILKSNAKLLMTAIEIVVATIAVVLLVWGPNGLAVNLK